MYVEGPGRWRCVRAGNLERQSIGEEARCTVQAKLASPEPQEETDFIAVGVEDDNVAEAVSSEVGDCHGARA